MHGVRVVAGALAVVALAGCGGTGGGVPAPPRPAPSSAASTSPQPPAPAAPSAAPTGCDLAQRLRGQDVEVLPTTGPVVALTFDAGGSDDSVASILQTLAAADVPATFFLTGAFAEAFPEAARAIAAAHPVGNHTHSHPDLTGLPDSQVRQEILDAAAAITRVTGADPRGLFRFPFGARDARTLAVVNAECYVAFRWTVDTLGWRGTSGGSTVATVTDRVLSTLTPGQIVLMHVGANPGDGSTLDADALPGIIEATRARGYSFTTLRSFVAR